ncbi:dual adapter for phosphotyrosine and 3-phosphotyrosine and 3-phosphoinositide isoform X2 [Ailuropoda melanoleuca]|uniref:dual adapter for phosphotyrosine and 3-phosphotyrosine and 3-phosphoinositide isoform X2 n=1 Tax=Ailuropoda melanoleuca TaxID=9646 RepID=UPI0009478E3A|nr:dual adapter for phosphotyrosine and 3-phosphotyrosine and 3-phosphoinositide isoform X2 [Ailuropoda melanoleuca]
MASGFFVNFTVVGTDATTGFSFSAVSVAWIGPQMNHTVSSVDNKHSGNHKIVVLLYTDRTKPVIEYSKLQNGSYNFFFWWKFSQSALNVTSPFNHSASHKHTAGTLIVLKHPYPRKVEEPSIYESVRVHTAMQTGRTASDLVPTAPSLGTKEGYLTKQGGLVKTWKTRWFTLHRNELKYFKDQMSPEPIRILDLTECSAVQFDYSQERVNCFCLVFPFRTFYLCAKTGVEADEWIKILRWKLSQIRKQLDQREGTIRSRSFIFK